jgi:hypothetical protein
MVKTDNQQEDARDSNVVHQRIFSSDLVPLDIEVFYAMFIPYL